MEELASWLRSLMLWGVFWNRAPRTLRGVFHPVTGITGSVECAAFPGLCWRPGCVFLWCSDRKDRDVFWPVPNRVRHPGYQHKQDAAALLFSPDPRASLLILQELTDIKRIFR